MAADYIPSKNALLVGWASNIATIVQAAPTSVGLVAGQATQLTSASTLLSSTYTTAHEPSTRTKETIQVFLAAKTAFLSTVRPLVKIIQAFPALTDGQRAALGITIPSPLSPINPPSVPPTVGVASVRDRTITIRIRSTEMDNRAKPKGCLGANVYAFFGATPPSALKEWILQGLASRTLMPIVVDPGVAAGSQLWLVAQWITARGLTSPASTPISTYIAGGVSVVA